MEPGAGRQGGAGRGEEGEASPRQLAPAHQGFVHQRADTGQIYEERVSPDFIYQKNNDCGVFTKYLGIQIHWAESE